MKQWKKRLTALLLVLCTILSLCVPAQAATIADGSKTCTVHNDTLHTYLSTTAGANVRGGYRYYQTNDGITGPAYCIDWGLSMVPSTKQLTITGKYTDSPETAGAFANGYPQRSLSDFLEIYSADYPALAGLTEDELAYATQLAVWATLGQLGVEGTGYTAGRATIAKPSGSAQKERVYTALSIILLMASDWTTAMDTGMYLRFEENKLGNTLELPADVSLEYAAETGGYGIQKETINGKEYYTRTCWAASATSTWPFDYCIGVWLSGAPAGTILTDTDNNVLPLKALDGGGNVYMVPTEIRHTDLNSNSSEYSGAFKLCLPVESVGAESGEVTMNLYGIITQYDIYLAYNPTTSEQSYIIADPGYGPLTATGQLLWGENQEEEKASLNVTKVGGGGSPLSGAEFTLKGSDGSLQTGITGADGTVTWNELDPEVTYTLAETKAPEGYMIAGAMNVNLTAGQTQYLTIQNSEEGSFTVKKVDAQNGASLQGAVFRFEQIDGGFVTTGITGHDGTISFKGGDELPYGSYRVTEEQPPEGYKKDTSVQTVEWDGAADILLTFSNVREMSFVIYKTDAGSDPLAGAAFHIYKDGELITSVETDDAGVARVSGLAEGYYEIEEIRAPEGFLLNSTRRGIYLDPYDPAVADDPTITIVNEAELSLRILKYDQKSKKPMPDVTFEIYKDGALFDTRTTDSNGEILLTGLEPGTYLAREVSTDGSHVINSTPQQIELKTGDGVKTLTFFNQLKPGIYLIKVDSQTMQSLPGVRFQFSLIGGSYQQEFTTDPNGEIDLSDLEPGAYEVRELEAPEGYLIDDAVRVVQIDPDEDANFVFTNTPKLTLRRGSPR